MTVPSAPANLGYRIPAEWEPHQATWLNWPNFTGTSFSSLQDRDHLETVFVRIVRALIGGEAVWINTLSAEHENHIRGFFAGDELDRLRFFRIPAGEPWLRDFSGTFVVRDAVTDPIAIVDWEFNAWGGRYLPSDLENDVPSRIGEECGFPRFETGVVLEGGAIDTNGAGTLLATESCVLNSNRNPGIERVDIERVFEGNLGAEDVIWLREGLAWDDLDGHVDAVARFVSHSSIFAAVEPNTTDANHSPLERNLDFLRNWTGFGGKGPEVIPLPMPAPIHFGNERPPASYLNFYIGNEVILVPSFRDAFDDTAAGMIADLFPSREVISIDCHQIVRDLGAIHCLLTNVPASNQPGLP